jgi:DinB superfamily
VARAPLTSEEVLVLLAEAPRSIAALTAGLGAARLRARPSPDDWSVNDVLAHMRSCADVWGGCIARMLAEDAPTIRAINPRHWIKRTDYPDLEFDPSLRAYTAQRAELLAVLEPLPPQSWSRSATVTGAGNVLQRTVLTYAAWLARHEQPHLKQITRLTKALQQ